MAVIAITNQKGGTGKTTLAISITAALVRKGYSAQLVDLDFQQQSAYTWSVQSEGVYFNCVLSHPDSVAKHIAQNGKNFDFYVLDCPPRADEYAAKIINAADFVLIPVQPSPYDVWATAELAELVRTKKEITAGPKHPDGIPAAALVLSSVIKNTRIAADVREALATTGLNVLDAQTTQFNIYKFSAREGRTIFDSSEPNKEACNQIDNITNEILEKYL